MTPTPLTVISGIVLLLLFAFVGWRLSRSEGSDRRPDGPGKKGE